MEGLGTTPIVALDVPGLDRALEMVRHLGDACEFYKVGSELFTAAGPRAVAALREQGKGVFLDLKLHDIPNTVRAAADSCATIGASMITVHGVGGHEMVLAAVEGAGARCRVLVVTVLTSMDDGALAAAWSRPEARVAREVERFAELAAAAGAHGVVCSGQEIQPLRDRFGDRLALLVPGIRFAEGAAHDQKRVVTPYDAAVRGARYLVLGRAVTGAPDPAAAMTRVRAEIRRAAAAGGA